MKKQSTARLPSIQHVNRWGIPTWMVALACLFLSVTAVAGPAETKFGLGTRMDLVPSSSFKVSGGGASESQSGSFGFGIGVVSEYQVFRYFKAGLDFMYYTLKNEKAEDRTDVIGLGPRLTGTYPLGEVGPFSSLEPYAFVVLGFTNSKAPKSDSTSGFWFQGGAGIEALFGPSIGAFAEFAYEGGFYGEVDGIETNVHAFGMALGAKYHF